MKRGRKPKSEVSPKIAAIRRLSHDGASSKAATRRLINPAARIGRGIE
jgi:hypothetical protein